MFNAQHLTTPFDIHATLKHILDFKEPVEGDLRNRGISLFNKVYIIRILIMLIILFQIFIEYFR
jgi:hypothetical protein